MPVIHKYPDGEPRPFTILSIGHPQREKRTIEQVIPPLLNGDPLSRVSLAYWLIGVEADRSGIYRVSRAYNNALVECESPIVVFTTGDSIIQPQLLWRAYGTFLETDRPVITMRIDQASEKSEVGNLNDWAIGDFMLVPREWAIEACGWDERMVQWGFTDYAFCLQLERIGHPPVILGPRAEDRTIHLWHPLRETAWYRAQNEVNKKIFWDGPPWTKNDFLAGRNTERS